MILFNIKHLISGHFGTHNIKEQFGTETIWDQDCMGCMSVGVYIDIVYITPTTRGDMCALLGVFGVCMSVGIYIGIVYIMPTIGGICVICWVSLGS